MVIPTPESEFARYELRYCAFIDILGFSSLVERARRDANVFSRIHQVLVMNRERIVACDRDSGHDALYSRRTTAFSDSVVISYPVKLRGSLQALIEDLVWLTEAFLEQQVLIRGGVEIGRLYHEAGIVFGDALVAAYQLESRHARNPRILVSERAIRWSEDHPILGLSLEERVRPEVGVEVLERLRRDHDGFWFIDFLGDPLFGSRRGPIGMMGTAGYLRRFVLDAMAEPPRDPDVRSKVFWIAEYYNSYARHWDELDELDLGRFRLHDPVSEP